MTSKRPRDSQAEGDQESSAPLDIAGAQDSSFGKTDNFDSPEIGDGEGGDGPTDAAERFLRSVEVQAEKSRSVANVFYCLMTLASLIFAIPLLYFDNLLAEKAGKSGSSGMLGLLGSFFILCGCFYIYRWISVSRKHKRAEHAARASRSLSRAGGKSESDRQA